MFRRKPETVPEPTHPSIERARKVANLLDSAFTIPVINKKVGLDPLLGLLPVGGDMIGAILGLYIVYVAYEVGLPSNIIIRMGVYIIIDILIGCIPLAGDVADFFWKSNRYNLQLLEKAYKEHGGKERGMPSIFKNAIEIESEPVMPRKFAGFR